MSEKIKIDDKIMELFYRLLELTPSNITDRTLHYNINGEEVTLTWFTRRENDDEYSMCPNYYNVEPFHRSECSPRTRGWDYGWKIDTSPELDGYTFYIHTSACQFRISNLSRKELLEVQEKIETHYKHFIPDFLQKLLEATDWD